MKLFVKCNRYGQPSYVSYSGQDQDTVTRLLTDIGATDIEFITEDVFNSLMNQKGA